MRNKKSKTGSYRDIPYESSEELAMLQWLFELKEAGYIRRIVRAPSHLLSEAMVHSYVISLKTKSKNSTQEILKPHSYTAEFLVFWNYGKARDRIVSLIGEGAKLDKHLLAQKDKDGNIFSYIECKPSYDFNNMTRIFVLNMKWMWQRYGLYVNLVVKDKLFAKTFTPAEFLKTQTGKVRRMTWRPRTLGQFLRSSK